MTRKEYEALSQSEERDYGYVNIYTCPKGHQTITIDRDDGVTPFMILCDREQPLATASVRNNGASVRCGLLAKSAMYLVASDFAKLATHEWYRPTFDYFQKHILNKGLREHIKKGGLCFRKIGEIHCEGAENLKINQ